VVSRGGAPAADAEKQLHAAMPVTSKGKGGQAQVITLEHGPAWLQVMHMLAACCSDFLDTPAVADAVLEAC
jgi:hypothetical protein